jgi:hypothetical protein
MRRLDRVARKGLRFGMIISRDVYAVQVLTEDMDTDDLTRSWQDLVEEAARRRGCPPPKLIVLRSPYREFLGPFLQWIERLAATHPDQWVAVIVPELVHRRWYHFLLHRRATLLKTLLLLHGGRQLVIVNVPWYPDE